MWHRVKTLFCFAMLCVGFRSFASEIEIHGRVVDIDGEGITRARVELRPWLSPFEESARQLRGEENTPLEIDRPDRQGMFTLTAPAGSYRLQVRATGYLPMEIRLAHRQNDVELRTLELIPASDVDIRVRNTAGEPVADAQVSLTSFLSARGPWLPTSQRVRTNPEGQVKLKRADPERGFDRRSEWVTAFAPPLVPTDVQSLNSNGMTLELAVGSARTIEVRDATGRPVAGALIRVSKGNWPVGWTDDDGRWAVFLPDEGGLQVTAETAAGDWGSRQIPAPQAGEKDPLILELEPPATLSGQVTNVETDHPLAGARVWLGRHPEFLTESGRDGSYTLSIPTSRRRYAQPRAAAKDYLSSAASASRGLAGASPNLELQPIVPLDGRVLDAEGIPIENAEVAIISPRNSGTRPPFTRSQEDGGFRLRAASNVLYQIEVSKPGYISEHIEAVANDARNRRLELVLQHSLMGVGDVVDPDGNPVAGADISLSLPKSASHRFSPEPPSVEHRSTTDAKGYFEIPHLEPATLDIEVAAPGYAPTRVRAVEVAANDDGRFDFGTLEIEPGVSIEGRVTDPDDNPLTDAAIQWQPFASDFVRGFSGLPGPNVATDADGRFVIPDLAHGDKFNLEARLSGYSQARAIGVEAPNDEPIILVLPPQANISGVVVDRFGEPVSEARLTIQYLSPGGGSHARSEACNADGSFELDADASDRVELLATSAELRSDPLMLEVAAGQIIDDLRLVLEPGAVVEGTVLGPTGEPIANAIVMAYGSSTSSLVRDQEVTDEAGQFRLAGLKPGPLAIGVHAEGFPPADRKLEVQPGRQSFEIRLKPTHEVSGRVVDEALRPIGGARVALSGNDGRGDSISNADGGFTLTVPDGRYRLNASKPGAFAWTELDEEIEVAGAPVTGLEVQLTQGGAIVGRVLGLDPQRFPDVYVTTRGGNGGQSAVDREGQYRIENLRPQEWTVVATLRSSGRSTHGRTVLEPGTPETVLDLEFTAGLRLTGQILIDGRPAPAAQILMFDLSRPSASSISRFRSQQQTLADYRGGFSFADLEPGLYRLEVRQDMMVRHLEFEMLTDREIEIELRSYELSGRVFDADTDDPLENVRVALEPVVSETSSTWRPLGHTDSRGRFHFDRVAEGRYRLRISLDDYAPLVLPLEVADGVDLRDLELPLERVEGLTLRVRLATGGTPPWIWVAALGDAGEVIFNRYFEISEGGEAHLSSLPPGRWRLLVGTRDAGTIPLTVEAPGDQVPVLLPPDTTLDVRVPDLEGGAEPATVTVTGADGRAFLELSSRTHLPVHQWHLDAGRAIVTGLPPGQWTVHVNAADGRTWSTPVVAPPQGGRQQLQIE